MMTAEIEKFGGESFLKFYLSGWKKTSRHNLLEETCSLIGNLHLSITKDEVNAGKNKVIHDMQLSLDNPFSSSGMLAEQLLYGENPTQIIECIDAVQSISFEEVVSAARVIFERNPSCSFVGNYEPPSYQELIHSLHGYS